MKMQKRFQKMINDGETKHFKKRIIVPVAVFILCTSMAVPAFADVSQGDDVQISSEKVLAEVQETGDRSVQNTGGKSAQEINSQSAQDTSGKSAQDPEELEKSAQGGEEILPSAQDEKEFLQSLQTGDLQTYLPYLLLTAAIALLLLLTYCLGRRRTKKLPVLSPEEADCEYERIYEEQKRYYAYCTEELLRAERGGFCGDAVMKIRREVLNIHNHMSETRKHVLSLKKHAEDAPDTGRKMAYLCEKERDQLEHLQELLKQLRKYRGSMQRG